MVRTMTQGFFLIKAIEIGIILALFLQPQEVILYAVQAVPSIMYDRCFRAVHYWVGQPVIKVAVVVNHVNLFRSNVVQQDLC